eukprot:1207427-Rhodomonas_salina.1
MCIRDRHTPDQYRSSRAMHCISTGIGVLCASDLLNQYEASYLLRIDALAQYALFSTGHSIALAEDSIRVQTSSPRQTISGPEISSKSVGPRRGSVAYLQGRACRGVLA